jgi:hypothetical protein
MSAVAVALVALGMAALTLIMGEPNPNPRPMLNIRVSGGGHLEKGKFYRVWARVDPAFADSLSRGLSGENAQKRVQAELVREVEALGFHRTLLATQDPSDPRVWSFLSYWRAPGKGSNRLENWSAERVEEPFLEGASPVRIDGLDRGMSRDLFDAVRWGLARENDPKRLEGFARTLDIDYPIAASLIRAKGRLETMNRSANRRAHEVSVSGTPSSIDAFAPLRDASAVIGGEYAAVWGKYERLEAISGWKEPGNPDYAFAERLASRAESEFPRHVVDDGFGKVIAAVTQEPRLLKLSAVDLSRELEVPVPVTTLGLMAMRGLGNGIVTVDAQICGRVLPEGPRPVSNSALRVAHAVLRPEGSQIASPRAIARRLHTLNGQIASGARDAKLAENSLERARRMLERQNWIEWYRRSKISGIMQ